MAIKARLTAARVTAPLAFLALASLATGAFVFARRAGHDEEKRLLGERAGEVAAILSSSINGITSSLRLLGDVYVAAGDRGRSAFSDSAKPQVAGGVASIGIAEVVADDVVVRAHAGSGPAAGERLSGARADVYRRAEEAGSLITARIDLAPDAGTAIAFASGRSDGLVVYAETPIQPSRPTQSTPQSPFRELNVALYRTATADPENLLITTSAALPFDGPVDQRTIAVGSEQWLLVSAAKGSISGAQSRAVPWIILGGGLGIAALAALGLGIATRRRQYALNLVDERTVDLQRAMVDLEAARAAADDANRAKSQFLSRMSHELRTPLNAVLGFAQLLELAELERGQRDSVEYIVKGGNHLLTLINEVLDISRIESGDIALSPESVLASDVVEETLDLMRPLAAERSIQLSTSREATCIQYVFADRQRLKQILLNLVSNAIKYNRLGGLVAVTCERPSATRLRLRVTDTGPGIAPADHGLVFVPFERLGAHLTDVEGSGIGLALSKRLAEAMGGDIGVESEIGQGATFWIELPLVEGAVDRFERLEEHTVTPVSVTPPKASTHKVLYVEDNLANLTLVERIVAHRDDLEIIPAMQGSLGVDLARQQRPEVILLDLHLPDTDGEHVLQQLRDDPITRSIPVIIISADATPGQVQRLQTAGASAYLTKPINVRELLRLLDEHLPAEV